MKSSGYGITIIMLLLTVVPARAQTTEAKITVVSLTPPRVRVEGARESASKVWSFRNSHAGISGLGERIDKLTLTDERGADMPVRKLAPGEYEAARDAVRFSYEIKLDPPAGANDAAHVSWLNESRAALMPGDLLPLPPGRARVSLKIPAGWKLAALENSDAAGVLDLADAESSVIFVGRDVREKSARVRGMELKVAIAGDWAFTDAEAVEVAATILKEHARSIGDVPRRQALIVLAPFPKEASASQWAAETRGGTVLYLSGRAATKTSALARLSPPLLHELFHLWVPNGLKLGGDYAWFYEGFTNYQALRASQRLGYLNFGDYLAALARAYDAYEPLKARDTASLLEASARRWTGSDALVYQKGMLVAALYDLNLRGATGGKRSLEDVYRALFQRRTHMDGGDGNTVVLGALDAAAGGDDFSTRFIRGVRQLDLGAELSGFGLRAERIGSHTRVVVAETLSRPQRDLLRQFGYNH